MVGTWNKNNWILFLWAQVSGIFHKSVWYTHYCSAFCFADASFPKFEILCLLGKWASQLCISNRNMHMKWITSFKRTKWHLSKYSARFLKAVICDACFCLLETNSFLERRWSGHLISPDSFWFFYFWLYFFKNCIKKLYFLIKIQD